MTKPEDSSVSFSDADMAKSYRHLRFMKALFEIDDPELERALLIIMDRLAAAKVSVDAAFAAAQTDGEPKSTQD